MRELAEQESVSVRTFTRRFRDEMGISPGQWLTQQRIDRARQLLEETLTVVRGAADAGFGTAASLRQQLHAAIGVSPTAYRGTFRRPEASTLPDGAHLRDHGQRQADRDLRSARIR